MKISPYIQIDGIRTFTDSYIKSIYNRMVDEGTADIVFSDGWITSDEAFLNFFKYGENYLFIIHDDEDLAAILWINRFLDKTCYAHFCGFKSSMGEGSVDIGRFAMNYIFEIKDDNGNRCFETVLGLIPSWNIKAISWLKKVGLVEIGKIPNGLWSSKDNHSNEGTLLCITKAILGGVE